MKKRYLLYLDFLGFKQMVSKSENRINKLYEIVNELNAHEHPNFKTIVFSDTLLIYNADIPEESNIHDNQYLVMYSIEFAQDLQQRLVGSDIFFRAQLRYDYFEHYNLKNVQCFYGSSLIRSYEEEENIQAIGIFIDEHCSSLNKIFPSIRYSKDMHFVYVNQSMESLSRNTSNKLPTDSLLLMETDEYWDILWDIDYFKSIYQNSREIIEPRIRSKYINTFHLFDRRYHEILESLIESNFEPDVICPNYDWRKMKSRYIEDKKIRVI